MFFYTEELQKIVKRDDVYKVEKVLAKKKVEGKVKVLVKWKGYPSTFNSWIWNSELQNL